MNCKAKSRTSSLHRVKNMFSDRGLMLQSDDHSAH